MALAILAFFGQHGTGTTDAALALIGICTTLIVGASVLDMVRVYQIEKRLELINEKTKELENTDSHVKIGVYLAWGFAFLN